MADDQDDGRDDGREPVWLLPEEKQLVYDALRGDVNEPTLVKAKKLCELQKLHHGVLEAQEKLSMLHGIGAKSPGLLRVFNPQHDAIVAAQQSRPHVPKSKSDTAELFGDNGEGTVSYAADAIQWAEDVPYPRPTQGQRVFSPSGQVASIVDVLGYDAERGGFRIVDADGWDGYVFSYGARDQSQWRYLGQSLDYADASDPTVAPQGTPSAMLPDLMALRDALLGSDAKVDDETYQRAATVALPMLVALANDSVAPQYLHEHVTTELAQADDNGHALALLIGQYVDVAQAQAGHEDVSAQLDAAKTADGSDDRRQALGTSVDDVTTEQALNDGTYEPEPETNGDASTATDGSESDGEHPTPGARTVGRGSKQRDRNAAAAGVKTAAQKPAGGRGKRKG